MWGSENELFNLFKLMHTEDATGIAADKEGAFAANKKKGVPNFREPHNTILQEHPIVVNFHSMELKFQTSL